MFDFSDYPVDSTFFYPVNKIVIGKIKGEFKGKIISEFVGWKSKMYSLVAVDGEEVKKANEVNRSCVKNIKYKTFVDALFNKKVMRHNIERI